MAAVAKVEISITDICPELVEVGRISMAWFDCICENGGGLLTPECEQLANDWSTLTVNLKQRLLAGPPDRPIEDID